MLDVKSMKEAALQLTKQQIKEAIESILRDSKRVEVRPGFKEYSDSLAMALQGFLQTLTAIGDLAHNSPKNCMFAVSSIVDAANSAAAVSTNKSTQNNVVLLTRDIAVGTAQQVLQHMIDAGVEDDEKQQMLEGIVEVREMVAELLGLLRNAAALEKQMDNAKRDIERRLESAPDYSMASANALEANVDSLAETAQLMAANIKTIQNNALAQPQRVGQYSQQASELMCEMLEATNVIAYQSGLDPMTLDVLAGAGSINPATQMQLQSMLAAAKGFAAATTNMIDMLREVPGQTDDENVQLRLAESTRSANTALNAFMGATKNLDTTNQRSSTANARDLEAEIARAGQQTQADLAASVATIDGASSSLHDHPAFAALAAGGGAAGGARRAGGAGELSPEDAATLLAASRALGDNSGNLLRAVAAAHQELIDSGQFAEIHAKDPNWTKALGASAHGVAETTQQLLDVVGDPNSSADEIIAAARCFNVACNRLVGVSHAHGDPNSEAYRQVDQAHKASAQSANQIMNLAKKQQHAKDALSDNAAAAAANKSQQADLDAIRAQTRNEQLRAEFEAQREIARLEAELETARHYLGKVRDVINDPNNTTAYEVTKRASIAGLAPISRGGGAAAAGAGAGAAAGRGFNSAPRGGAAGGAARGAPAPRGAGAPRGAPGGAAPRGGAPRGGAAPRGGGPAPNGVGAARGAPAARRPGPPGARGAPAPRSRGVPPQQ